MMVVCAILVACGGLLCAFLGFLVGLSINQLPLDQRAANGARAGRIAMGEEG